jgi:hypothetical protein
MDIWPWWEFAMFALKDDLSTIKFAIPEILMPLFDILKGFLLIDQYLLEKIKQQLGLIWLYSW